MTDWMKQTNVYEVNLRQYTAEGTINAFKLHLPRLKDMGVKTLWFMPLAPISQKNKKGELGSYYACSTFNKVDREFGTIEDWKKLVKEAHNLGFKVILDWVANHTGWDHDWTVEHPDWYRRDENTGDFKKASGMDDIIELDYNNTSMRQAMIEAMKWWVEQTGIDGFRCDLAFWVQLDFWVEAKKELEKAKPLFWFGELDVVDNPEYMQVFNAAYTWRWMHASENFYKERYPLHDLINVLDQYKPTPGTKAWFTSNHDENSWNGTEYEKYGAMAKALAVFSCTWPGIPLIYSGQELPNKKRLEFFRKDTIEWTSDIQLHNFYKCLLQLQGQHPALASDADVIRVFSNADDKIFCYMRHRNEQKILVMLNFSDQPVDVDLNVELNGEFVDIFHTYEPAVSNVMCFRMQPWDYAVLESK
jgi:alpha-amylase